jgi:hypothetical protein
MARYAGGGKNTVEGCRSIDVLEWHRRGYLRSPGWFSCAWTRDGERLASINVQAQRDQETTLNALAVEAFNDLLKKHGKRQSVENPLLD